SLGYEVKAEINHIDILASKEDYFIACELKTNISLKLIYQAIERQKIVDEVYIATDKKHINSSKQTHRHLIALLKRLEIGLIAVSSNQAEIVLASKPFDYAKSRALYQKKKEKMKKEFMLSKTALNTGGTKGKIMTRYKEMVTQIGIYILDHGPSSPKAIKQALNIEKVSSILQKNYYQYFVRIDRGIYDLTQEGRKEILKMYHILKDHMMI
ncbi:MAG: DUF2161 family putative PD-(D/E)XK-type phosphodiesterase, partial [Acholeplasmataceae bacterium]